MSAGPQLTPRQIEIRNFVLEFQEAKGRRPTYQEIGRGLGIKSTETVSRHMKKLEKIGELRLRYAAKAAATG